MISSSSSNRTPGQCDAVLTVVKDTEATINSATTGLATTESIASGTAAIATTTTTLAIDTRSTTGPLRLPINDPASFVARFNRIYARIGLSIQSVHASEPQSPSPDSQKPTMTQDENAADITPEMLRQKKCVPCEGGVPVIEAQAAVAYMRSLPNWSMGNDQKSIFRQINAGNFEKAMDWMQKIAEIAESEQHHPDLHLTGYRNLRIELTTHAIGGLSENDFVVAAKIDTLLD